MHVLETVRNKTISELVGQVGEAVTTEQQAAEVMGLHDRIMRYTFFLHRCRKLSPSPQTT